MLTWKMKCFIALVIFPAFVNFLAFRETNHKFKVQTFRSAHTTVSQIAIAICCVGNVSI